MHRISHLAILACLKTSKQITANCAVQVEVVKQHSSAVRPTVNSKRVHHIATKQVYSRFNNFLQLCLLYPELDCHLQHFIEFFDGTCD